MATFIVITAVLTVAAALGVVLALDLTAEYFDVQAPSRFSNSTASANSDTQTSQSPQR